MGGDRAVFALRESQDYGSRLARAIGAPLSPLEERYFEDGEHKTRPLREVSGLATVVIASLFTDDTQSANDKLCRLLFLVGALRDHGASEITVVAPYLCYARKDRRTKPHDPVTARYVAQIIEAVGTDRIVTVDVHNPAAFENAHRIPATTLSAVPALVDAVAGLIVDGEAVTVVSPDLGGIKRAEQFAERMAVQTPSSFAVMEKHRSEGVVSGTGFFGDVAGRTAVIVDDMIAGGGTIRRAAVACRARGARRVIVAATHGLFLAEAASVVADAGIERIVVGDTVPPFRLPSQLCRDKILLVDTVPLLAGALR